MFDDMTLTITPQEAEALMAQLKVVNAE